MKFSISSITFTNYRQYRGTHTINFDIDTSKNVSIILGKNGAGKSNLLNSLTWCLYGIEIHKDQDSSNSEGMPIINTSELVRLENSQSTYAEAIIHLRTNMGPWTIRRSVEGGKDSRGNIFISESKLTVVHPVGGQDKVEEGEDTQVLINNLLPEALRTFFFIDGEQLREFFKVSTPQKIADAIDKVSQLELIYESASHFEILEKSLRRNVKDSTPKLEEVQRKIQILKKKIDQLSEEIKTKNSENEKCAEDLKKITNFLRTYNISTISSLQKESDSVHSDTNNLKRQIEDLESERNSYLVDIAPFIYLKSTIKKAYTIIEEKVEKGELPPRIKETFIRELLERGRCICGNELCEDSRRELEDYSKKLSLSELSAVSIIGKTTISDILLDINKFPETIDKQNLRIDNLKDQLEKKQRRLEQISEELKNSNIEEIKLNEEKKEKLYQLIERNKQILKMKGGELDHCKKEVEKEENEEQKELAKNGKNIVLKTKLSLVKESLKTLATVESVVKSKIRNQVEQNTKKNFFTLIRKKQAFEDILIDKEYNVKVLHSHGYNVIDDLSAGEYLILGLSFMSSLMTISGFHAPVIIDTPLGKIDDVHREYITTELPRFLNGTQLILLVTPTEYDPQVKANLNRYLLESNYYEIQENEINTESRVWQNVN
ncbi:AAA family ATPase [Methanosarcina mazei]|uniref:AAA family ATPase n=1 Tax=Methanosarcina mazei TaxID=2209 RepID=UPI003C72112F